MAAHAIFFYFFSIVAVISAIMVTVSKNTVHSVFFLILDFISISCLFIMIGAEFLGMIMLIVYVGAVAVLFLFVVMMLNVAQQKNQWFNSKENSGHIPIGLIISTIIAASIITFDINDPSFSYLSDSATNNILGKYGAYTSDLLIKLFGASSVLIFLISFAWGLKLFIHKKITFFWLRLIFVPITLLSTSATLNIENIFNINMEGGGIAGKYTFLYITNLLQHINFEITQIYISIFFFEKIHQKNRLP